MEVEGVAAVPQGVEGDGCALPAGNLRDVLLCHSGSGDVNRVARYRPGQGYARRLRNHCRTVVTPLPNSHAEWTQLALNTSDIVARARNLLKSAPQLQP